MKSINHSLIGERIRLERKKRKLTQAQLAERAELSTNYIGCIECGSKQGSFNVYFKIVEALEISFDTILLDYFKFVFNPNLLLHFYYGNYVFLSFFSV